MRRSPLFVLAVLLFCTALPLSVAAQQHRPEPAPPGGAALRAPFIPDPPDGTRLVSVGPVSLGWDLPAGAAQVQVQVTPFNGDGPGLNLIRNAGERLTIAAPPTWYVLLPGMTYTWRVRVTPLATPVTEDDLSWSPWSSTWRFVTPPPSSAGLRPGGPADGGEVAAGTATLRWQDSAPDLFYYEVQVSTDREFRTGPDATAAVWWNLAHGGVSEPRNSWTTPPLAPGAVHFWRVRPRVQGDGAPAAWGPAWSFTVTGGVAATPTPSPLPSPTATPAPAPTPTPTAGASHRLAFTSTRDGSPDLYVMPADGGAPVRVTRSSAVEENIVWSPDGARLAFDAFRDGGRGIYVVNADGSDEQRLTANLSGARMPAWSAVTGRIAYSGSDREAAGTFVYTMLPDGSGMQRLEATQGAERPVWSPTAGTLAYVASTDGNKNIYTVAGTGGPAARLTDSPAADADPVWSPDGARIAFVSERDGNSEIYVMNTDGSGLLRLTSHTVSDTAPAWSPDGKRIAFLSNRNGVQQIYVMNADGSAPARLTQTNANEGRPAWSPDGNRIAFASTRDGDQEIYVMNADGSAAVNLTQSGATSDSSPFWAPK